MDLSLPLIQEPPQYSILIYGGNCRNSYPRRLSGYNYGVLGWLPFLTPLEGLCLDFFEIVETKKEEGSFTICLAFFSSIIKFTPPFTFMSILH